MEKNNLERKLKLNNNINKSNNQKEKKLNL